MALFTIFAAIAVATAGASYIQARKAQKIAKKAADDMAGVLLNKESNIQPIPVIYGERRVGGVRVYMKTHGQTKNEYLTMAVVLAEGEINSVSDLRIDDIPISDPRFSGLFNYEYKLGSDGQTKSTVLSGSSPAGWTDDHKLSGVAYIAIRLKWDQDVFSGIPDITAVVKGKKIYDPRLDSTVSGGSGSHRSDDSSTWAWSDNPSLCIRDYLTNNRYGKGLSESSIDTASFIEAADDCDSFTVTPYSGGPSSHKIFETNAVLDTGTELFENIQTLLLGCRGFLPFTEGKYALKIDQASTSQLTLTTDNIIGGISIAAPSKSEKFNRVVAKFPNPSTSWQPDSVTWPNPESQNASEAAIAATFLTEDNDEILTEDIDLETITDLYAARDLARILCLRSRSGTNVSLRANSDALDLAVGDVVQVTHPTPAWTNKKLQVQEIGINYDGTVSLILLDYDATIYAYEIAEEELVYPDADLPDPNDPPLSPSNVAADSEVFVNNDGIQFPQIRASWPDPGDAFIDHYLVEWKHENASSFNSATTKSLAYDITGIKNGNTYNVKVSSVNVMGVSSSPVSATDAVIPSTSLGDVRLYAGSEIPQGANFTVDASGHVTARDITIYRSDGSILLSSSDGFSDDALTQISTVTGTPVTTLSETLTSDTDTETITLVAETDLTLKAKLNSAFFGSSTVSGADALSDIPENFTVKILYKLSTAGSYTELASQTYTRTTGTPTATQYQADTSVFEFGSEVNAYAFVTRSLGSVDADGFSTLTASLDDLAGAGSGTSYLFKTEISTTDTSYNTNDNHVTSSAYRVISITSGGTGFYIENGTGSQGVPEGDITAVAAGTNLTGGGTSGDVTLNLSSTISGNHTFSNNLTVSGDLTVNGTTTTLNTANLDVEDKNITLNYGAGDTSASANGAGITIQDAVNSTTDATILWDATNDEFDFSHGVTAPNLNVTNWNTAYSYSQVGHLPLSGGTLTGDLTIAKGTTSKQAYHDLYIGGNALDGADSAIYIGNAGTGGGYGWEIFYNGAGSANLNKLIIRSENAGNPVDALSFNQDGAATFGNTIAATGGNSTNWNTAYNWGDHATAGYYPASNPNGYTSNVGDITDVVAGLGITGGSTSGSATISMDWVEYDAFTGTYPIVWKAVNKPYSASWFTINGTTDTVTAPNFTATTSLRANVLYDSNNTGNYLDSPTSSVFRLNGSTAVNLAVGGATKLVADASGIDVTGTVTATGGNSTNWNTAYSWGDHAAAGYAVGSFLPLGGGTLGGTLTISNTYPTIKFQDLDNNPDWTIIGASGRIGFYDETNTTEVVQINSTGIDVTGTTTVTTGENAWAFKATSSGATNYSGLWFTGTTARLLLRDGSGNIKTMLAANGTNSENVINGNTIWHAGNDGSGSGLDADLLDGQQGSYYATASSLGSYLPLTGGTLTGTLYGQGATFTSTVSVMSGIQVNHNFETSASVATLRSDAPSWRLWQLNSGTQINAVNGGAVSLSYDGSTKLTTTSTGIDVNGTATVDGLTTSGVIKAPDGSNSAPAYTNSGDADGGMYFPAANQVSFASGGLQRLNIGSGGDISFYEDTGTTAKFFWDASAESLCLGNTAAGAKLDIRQDSGYAIRLEDNNGYYFRVAAGGATEIGGNLDVTGIAKISGTEDEQLVLNSTDDGPVYMSFKRSNDRHAYLGFGGSSDNFNIMNEESSGVLTLGTNASERLRIDSSGSVTANVDLRAPIFYDNGNTGNYLDSPSSSIFRLNGSTAVNLAVGGTTKLVATTNGIGIGTSSPTGNYTTSLHIHGSGTGASLHLTDPTSGATASDGLEVFQYGTDGYIWEREAGNLRFGTSATERLRISSSGLVGIGTSSPNYELTVAGGSNNSIQILSSTTGTGAFNGLRFWNTGSSTAMWNYDNTPTLFGTNNVERMRIDSSGSVTANVDLRAPIFYDSNNTAYYVDPNSTGLSLSSNGIVSSGTGVNGGFQNRTYTGGRNRIWSFGNADGYGISYFQGGPDYIGLHVSGNPTQANSDFWVSSAGISQTSQSSRAPIFYDSDNTAYYVNPNGTSVLSNLNATGTGHVFGSSSNVATTVTLRATNTAGAPAHTATLSFEGYEGRGQGTFHTDVSYAGQEWFSGIPYASGFSVFQIGYDAAGGQAEYGANSIARFTNAGDFQMGTTTVIDSSRNFYGATFYDSDNTGYYVNPLNTSVMNVVTIGGSGGGFISRNVGSQTGSLWLAAASSGTGGANTVSLAGGATTYMNANSTGIDVLGSIEINGTTAVDSSRNLTNIGNITSTADNSFLSMGVAGAGSTVGARFLSIEGNTDTSGEGSGRIFFTEHNSTTASMDNYGMSIGYRGGADIVEGASGNTWDGLSQIGNGEWGMWGHNNSASGSLIMYGDRAASFINFAGNGLDGVGRVRFSDTSPTLSENGNYLRIQTATGYTDIGSGNTAWTHFHTDRGGFYFNKAVNAVSELKVYGTNSRINSAGAYAPTFYDSNNSNNYLDSPTSSVFRLNGSSGFVLSANGSTIVTGNSGGIDVVGTATADVLEAQGGSYSASIDSVANAGIILTQDKPIYSLSSSGNYLRNLIKHDSSNNIVLGQSGTSLIGNVDLYSGSSGLVRFYTSGLKAQITSTGAVQGASFEDYNNTSYYLDPSNTGVSLNAAGGVRAGNGSVAAPAFTFTGNGNTGIYRPSYNVLGFSTGGTLRMLINTVGTGYWYGSSTTSTTNANLVLKGSVDTTTGYQPQNYHVTFQDGGGTVRGSISSSHYATIYSTSSDYRLKEDLQPIANATSRLMALNPVNFRWVDGQQRSDGFIAHELAEAGLPEAVTGTKDAVDADGNPEYQGIDQSKLVPLLVKTIQELEARITALESA